MASASSPATADGQAATLGVAASATDTLLARLPEDPLKEKTGQAEGGAGGVPESEEGGVRADEQKTPSASRVVTATARAS